VGGASAVDGSGRDPSGDGLRGLCAAGRGFRGGRGVLSQEPAAGAVDRLFREHFGRAVAALIRAVGDWDLAEEAVQDAFATALERWPRAGVPRDPAAWIVAVARNRAIDRLRHERVRRDHKAQLAALAALTFTEDDEPDGEEPVATSVPDERLRLIFTCCHPALAPDAQVALTLRMVGGLSTAEVADAFLVPEATMAQRLVRAKAKIRAAGIPFRVPRDEALPERLATALDVIYLVFNEGYAASAGDAHVRRALCAEAVRLAATIAELMPDESEALGLYALRLAHDARREARIDASGALVLLDDQDRTRWDQRAIAQAARVTTRALRLGPPGATSCRPRSRSSTCAPPRPPTPAGNGSPPVTATWPRSRPIRSSSSTAPWRSRRPETSPVAWRASTRSRPRWTATTTSTLRAQTCFAASARATRPPTPTLVHWNWPATRPSVRSSRAGSQRHGAERSVWIGRRGRACDARCRRVQGCAGLRAGAVQRGRHVA
jgi:RNA polymerase sigma factor (sigma-70 family)